MILAECTFSQSATGEVSSAYFRKLAISRGGEGKFSQMGPTRAYGFKEERARRERRRERRERRVSGEEEEDKGLE